LFIFASNLARLPDHIRALAIQLACARPCASRAADLHSWSVLLVSAVARLAWHQTRRPTRRGGARRQVAFLASAVLVVSEPLNLQLPFMKLPSV
jgi:hypothetical protein